MTAVNDKISTIVNGKRVIMKKPELLAPAGNLEKLKIAVHYGADAVFIGGQEYGLRSNADNFTIEEIAEGVEFAKKYGAKIYVTTNIFAHNENMDGLERLFKSTWRRQRCRYHCGRSAYYRNMPQSCAEC